MKKVYMSFSSDIIHNGHINIIKKAAKLGELTIGALTDNIVASYKRYPILSCRDRMDILRAISGVNDVVEQNTLSYANILRHLKPDYLVHGDDWQTGFQKPIREEAINVLSEWGGELIEFPYNDDQSLQRLELHARSQLSIPDIRRGRLKKLLGIKPLITAMEAHSGLTGLIVENSKVLRDDGSISQFDAMWISSLCDSTAKGKPDIELVDMTSRMRTIEEIMEVTTKPIIFDGDTGGQTEHFAFLIRSLERIGVSAVIIEDKTGLKKNSLFGTEVEQTQDSIKSFCEKIKSGKSVQKTNEMMIIARIESLILEKGMDDALDRAFAYKSAGADGIMIHSRKMDPSEIFTFCRKFREKDAVTPIVVVPTSFSSVTENEFASHGVNIVIYANQFTRSAVPAMQKTADMILTYQRAEEADEFCMPFEQIIRLIPEV